MRIQNFLVIAAIISAISIQSCKKDDDITDPNPTDTTTIAEPDTIKHQWFEIIAIDSSMKMLEGALTAEFTVNAFHSTSGIFLGQCTQYEYDVILMNINTDNEIQWVKSFGLTNSYPIDLITNSTGDAILYYYDGVEAKKKLAKISADGDIIWVSEIILTSNLTYNAELALNESGKITITNYSDYVVVNQDGSLSEAFTLSVDQFNVLQHNGKYFGATRMNGGATVALYQLNANFELENTKMIGVPAHNHNINSMFFIGNTLYVGVTVDQGLSGMETRMFTFDESLNALKGYSGQFYGQYGDYMFSQIHQNTLVYSSDYFVFGGFHSQGNLGNLDLGYHTVVAKADFSAAYSFDVGMGGAIINSNSIHVSGLSGFIEQISDLSTSSNCMSEVTFSFTDIGTSEILESTYELAITTGSAANVSNSSATLIDFTARPLQTETCVND